MPLAPQLPLQQSLPLEHAAPLGTHAQSPPTQLPLQQSALVEQARPVTTQQLEAPPSRDSHNIPAQQPVEFAEQAEPTVMQQPPHAHAWPPAHWGVAVHSLENERQQMPPRQDIPKPQQSASLLQVFPPTTQVAPLVVPPVAPAPEVAVTNELVLVVAAWALVPVPKALVAVPVPVAPRCRYPWRRCPRRRRRARRSSL